MEPITITINCDIHGTFMVTGHIVGVTQEGCPKCAEDFWLRTEHDCDDEVVGDIHYPCSKCGVVPLNEPFGKPAQWIKEGGYYAP